MALSCTIFNLLDFFLWFTGLQTTIQSSVSDVDEWDIGDTYLQLLKTSMAQQTLRHIQGPFPLQNSQSQKTTNGETDKHIEANNLPSTRRCFTQLLYWMLPVATTAIKQTVQGVH